MKSKCLIGLVFGCCLGLSAAEVAEVYDLVVAGGTLAAVREAVAAAASGQKVLVAAPRPYLGEDRAATLILERLPTDDPKDPLISEIFNPAKHPEAAYNAFKSRGWRAVDKFAPYTQEVARLARELKSEALASVTTPLLIKRACDQALLSAKVEFLTSAQIVEVIGDSPQLRKVKMVFRGGERTLLTRRFVDHRMQLSVQKCRQRFAYRYVVGPKVKVECLEFDFDVPYAGVRGYLAAQNHARSLVPVSSNLLDVAEMVIPLGTVPKSVGTVPTLPAFDVVVAGGGTAGAPAALAAARSGAKVLLIEFQQVLGGVSGEGRIGGYGSYYDGNVTGFTVESDQGARSIGGPFFFAQSEFYRREIVKNGGEVCLGTMVTGADVGTVPKNVGTVPKRLQAVRVVLPDGTMGTVPCQVAVDATGNCDLAAAAGCTTEFISADELSLQGAGMAGQPLGVSCCNSDIGFVDDTDATDLCAFALRSRLSLPDGIWNQSSLVDSRERRRLVGEFRVSPLDLVLNRTYPDTVVIAQSSFDTHGQTTHPLFYLKRTGTHGKMVRGNIPYRALLPREVDGLLVAGLGISAHRDAMPVLRMQADIRNQGYAVGLAAAMAVKAKKSVHSIAVKSLQRQLVAIGNLPESVLTAKDSLPLSDLQMAAAAKRLDASYDTLAELLSDPERARQLLKADNSQPALVVRALLGDGAASPLLVEKLRGVKWDEGWNFRGMGQYNWSLSRLDAMVMALGNAGNPVCLPLLDDLARQLNGQSEYSHFRALAYAYEKLKATRSAAVLGALLKLPGISGHALKSGGVPRIAGYSDQVANEERSNVLRELCLARALYRLGDPEGEAQRRLKTYLDDPRRVYANYVRKVMVKK